MIPCFLVIDKPAGVTSHDVVAAVRAVTGVKKVGHTGTLDPFATGVLPLALGGATRLIQFLDESIKVYDATIALGTCTDTGDCTGKVIREGPLPTADAAGVDAVLSSFIGDRMQKPPAYSAVKHKGKRLYQYARKGETVEVPARPIVIHDMRRLGYDGNELRVEITCSRGTYARVLADEVASALGSAGHLSALQRPRSGPFYLDDALSMAQLAEQVAPDSGKPWQEVVLRRAAKEERVPWRPRDDVRAALTPWLRRPLEVLSQLPLADVSDVAARRVRNGGPPPPPPPGTPAGGRYAVVHGADLVAVAENAARGPRVLRTLASGSIAGGR